MEGAVKIAVEMAGAMACAVGVTGVGDVEGVAGMGAKSLGNRSGECATDRAR
ncbi:MAG: hypothetical protein NVS3B20_00050 [Polyangiales bacterium]